MLRFKNAKLLTCSDRKFSVSDGVLETENDRISHIGAVPTEKPADRTIDLHGTGLIMPGFKNAHAHSAMTFLRSYADDLPLDKWLNDRVFPMEAKINGEDIYTFARLGFLEYLRNGITSSFDMYFMPDFLAKAAADMGFRLVICGAVNDFRESPEKLEDCYLRLNKMSDLISFRLGFHAEYTASEIILKAVADLSHKYSAPVFTHCSETASEVNACIARHGLTPPMYFDRLGLLDNGGGFFHCVHVTDEDIKTMKKRNIAAVLNPCSNAKLASGIAPVKKLLTNVTVGIGTDGPAGNNALDMFREMYLAASLPKLAMSDAAAVNAEDILYAATAGSAEIMGLSDCTSLSVGMKADMAVIDLDCPNMRPLLNIPKNIVYSGDPSNIAMTVLNGNIVYEHGEFHLPNGTADDIIKAAEKSIQSIKNR